MKRIAKIAFISTFILASCQTNNETDKVQFSSGQKCVPVYEQVYQPPLKIGGSGRVINVKTGENCEPSPEQNLSKMVMSIEAKTCADSLAEQLSSQDCLCMKSFIFEAYQNNPNFVWQNYSLAVEAANTDLSPEELFVEDLRVFAIEACDLSSKVLAGIETETLGHER